MHGPESFLAIRAPGRILEMTMPPTRAEIEELVIRLASSRPSFRELLKNDPHQLVRSQLGLALPPRLQIEVLEESPEQIYLVLPHLAEPGAELADEDLEAIAGGHTLVKDASCEGGGGTFGTVNVFEAAIALMTEAAVAGPAGPAPVPVSHAKPHGGRH